MDKEEEILEILKNDLPSIDLNKIQILYGPDGETNCITLIISNEDHTLCNALRFMLNKNPDVQFAGYVIPHPSDPKVNFRIQTEGTTNQKNH